jgi:LysR family transcriptional regulator, glycine cleavage system transcriptional activator
LSKLPPFLALRALASVARHQSVTKAARELNVTHAAISHQIKSIEEWFGRSLFERIGRGIEPAPDAVKLGSAVDDALSLMERACRDVIKSTAAPQVTVACIPSVACWWLVPRLPSFLSRYTDIRVHLVYAVPGVSLDGSDIVIDAQIGPIYATEPHGFTLMNGRTYPVCSKHYLAAGTGHIDWSTLEPSDLLHDERHETWELWLRNAGYDRPIHKASTVFQDFNLLTAALMSGQGIALCPTWLFRRELDAGDLLQLSETPANEDKDYRVTVRQQNSLASAKFVHWLREEMLLASIPTPAQSSTETAQVAS